MRISDWSSDVCSSDLIGGSLRSSVRSRSRRRPPPPLPRSPPPMAMDTIRIRGARTHNLKNIDLDLPRDRLIVITGLSGPGKPSLAFATIHAEGQRRYVKSLSAHAPHFQGGREHAHDPHHTGHSTA